MEKDRKNEKKDPEFDQDKISRSEALKKGGKYALATAATMFLVLSPLKSQTESPPPPGW